MSKAVPDKGILVYIAQLLQLHRSRPLRGRPPGTIPQGNL